MPLPNDSIIEYIIGSNIDEYAITSEGSEIKYRIRGKPFVFYPERYISDGALVGVASTKYTDWNLIIKLNKMIFDLKRLQVKYLEEIMNHHNLSSKSEAQIDKQLAELLLKSCQAQIPVNDVDKQLAELLLKSCQAQIPVNDVDKQLAELLLKSCRSNQIDLTHNQKQKLMEDYNISQFDLDQKVKLIQSMGLAKFLWHLEFPDGEEIDASVLEKF
jgi:hypothetical protein